MFKSLSRIIACPPYPQPISTTLPISLPVISFISKAILRYLKPVVDIFFDNPFNFNNLGLQLPLRV